jgi:uncharacterized membrane protein YcaP (DUF421 family)
MGRLSLPWWEFIARASVVYLFLLVILRVTGKRQGGNFRLAGYASIHDVHFAILENNRQINVHARR